MSKELPEVDGYCRKLISLSLPLSLFLVIASSDERGSLDATPRGGAPGFVIVLNDKTLLIPDRRGNNRVDTMMNITENPRVGLLFFLPGAIETLRVNGRAKILIVEEMLGQLTVDGNLRVPVSKSISNKCFSNAVKR